jgi:hypothetical protein
LIKAHILVLEAVVFLLLLLGGEPAQAQRLRSSTAVTFYAAPDGTDFGNDCRSQQNPCTPKGAHRVAFRDWDFADSGCTIRLRDGSYKGDAASILIAGQYVGAHLCQVYGHVDENDICTDATAVVFDVPAGNAAFDLQDLMMTSIACITVQGANAIGFHARQYALFDLAYINCGAISQCLSLSGHSSANLVGDIWISGNATGFIAANQHSRVSIARGARIIATQPVSVTNFIQSHNHSMVEFLGDNKIVNSGFLSDSICQAYRSGSISLNGTAVPCSFPAWPDPGDNGKVHP